MERNNMITVSMTIDSNKFKPINKMWDIKFERDIVQQIPINEFKFSSLSMNVAITKVTDLVSRHPENYFKEIIIK